ncbi:class I SAM-dependent methyltransferase [Metabacillus arenae]|uniref:class I SAM-dependent methyltransferase n=1 Tax=Metabacillus arenae TaxID=2771434 RepID=UPI001CD0AA23|nr:methyltransferase domain-containing protein [Metabacillus arenae]
MNNKWNQFIYKAWSPIYDQFFNKGLFLKARKRVFDDIQLMPGSKVLLVGVGTGADLVFFMDKGYHITAIDFSEDMLNQAKKKYPKETLKFIQLDAQELKFPDCTFDMVATSLILSVVPDPNKTIKEMVQVVKPEKQVIIFDKFVNKNTKPSIIKTFFG